MESLTSVVKWQEEDLYDDSGNLFQRGFRASPTPYINKLANKLGITGPDIAETDLTETRPRLSLAPQ